LADAHASSVTAVIPTAVVAAVPPTLPAPAIPDYALLRKIGE
jgi:hypothetical protein